jgi:hypothetical protein
MLGMGGSFSYYRPGSSAMALAKDCVKRNGADAAVSKMLVMCWVLHDIKLKGAEVQFKDVDDPDLMSAYYEQFFRLQKKNERKTLRHAKKFEYPPLKEYYL